MKSEADHLHDLQASAFANIIVCECGHGIGGHRASGCSCARGPARCDCERSRSEVIEWLLNGILSTDAFSRLFK